MVRALLALALIGQCLCHPCPVHAASRAAAEAPPLPRDVHYRLDFDLTEDKPAFEGQETLDFKLARVPASGLEVDFAQGAITSVSVNGRELAPVASSYDGQRLRIAREALVRGANRVQLRFSHPYEPSGLGLNRLRDPADGRSYVFAQTEPRGTRRIFPCFDRPDVKASYELAVSAPSAWTVIANGRETRAPKTGEKWRFAPTPRFSTYLFVLDAGPFASWSDRAGDVPIRLFAPMSLSNKIDFKSWLATTREGLRFFATWFARPYPFGKYDQVITPRPDPWATENVAATTFTASPELHTRYAILHELAHAWTGDLVTMSSWRDYWLKEALTNVAAEELAHDWSGFFAQRLKPTLEADDAPGSLPLLKLYDPASDTDDQLFNLVSATKGAAVLRQLQFSLGPKVFQKGMRELIRRYAFGSFSTHDFLAILSRVSGRDLASWGESWLGTPGVNTLGIEQACDAASKLSSLSLVQGGSPFRSHRVRISLVYDGQPARKKSLDVAYSGPRTPVPGVSGKPCPSSITLNDDAYDYVKVR